MEWKRCAKNGDIFRWFTAIRWISDITQRAHHSKQQHILCANARHICATPNAAIQNCKYFNQKFSECSIFSESLSLSLPLAYWWRWNAFYEMNISYMHFSDINRKNQNASFTTQFSERKNHKHTHTLRCVEHVRDIKRTIYLCFL